MEAKGAAEALLGCSPLGDVLSDLTEHARYGGRCSPTFAITDRCVSRPAREAGMAQRYTRTGSARRDEDARGHAGSRELRTSLSRLGSICSSDGERGGELAIDWIM